MLFWLVLLLLYTCFCPYCSYHSFPGIKSLYRVVFDNHLQISNMFSSNISFNFQTYINLMHALLEIKHIDKIMYTCKHQNFEVTTHKYVHHISFITTNQRPPN